MSRRPQTLDAIDVKQLALGVSIAFVAGCTPVESNVLLNELTWQAGGKIELANATSVAVDVSGWTVRRAAGGLGFTFTDGVKLEPGAHLVLTQKTDQPFVLQKSDTVLLEDETGLLIDQVKYTSGQADLSYCRIPDADGLPQICSRATFGGSNQP